MATAITKFRRKQRGFTLIELIIVCAVIAILVSIAVPIYAIHVKHAREAVLKENLHTMREAIDQYTQDKDKAPQSLDDLVSAGYLKSIPKDPITNAANTWETTSDDSIMSLTQTDSGITDVHSGSKDMSSEGTSYNTW